MTFLEFLQLVKVVRMLYGRDVAERFFTKNINKYYNLNSESISNIRKVVIQ
jgi:hypothetical protein